MRYDYQTKGYSQYGASMGRRSDLPNDASGPLTIRHVSLNEGGYDFGGAYWGSPDDLYCVADGDMRVRYLRAPSLDAARAEFPKATWEAETGPNEGDVADMIEGYIRCALWISTDDDGGPLDANYSEADLAPETLAAMQADVSRFAAENARALAGCDYGRAGHDLWLSRNGHGAGFFDAYKGIPYSDENAATLQNAARRYGEVNLIVGDDGRIYS